MVAMFVLLSALSFAKPDPCASIKPEQQLETHQQHELDSLVKAGIVGLGSGQASVQSSGSTDFDTQLLEKDDLARSWYVYQLCVMKRDGVLTSSLHEALMRELFGLEPKEVAAPHLVAATGAASSCPWGHTVDTARVSGKFVVVNDMSFPVKKRQERQAFSATLNECRKGDAVITFDKWMRTRPAGVGIFRIYAAPVTVNPGAKQRFVNALLD